MRIFSEENIEKLNDELRLTIMAINSLQQQGRVYAHTHGHDTVVATISALRVKKLELEVKIAVLNDHISG